MWDDGYRDEKQRLCLILESQAHFRSLYCEFKQFTQQFLALDRITLRSSKCSPLVLEPRAFPTPMPGPLTVDQRPGVSFLFYSRRIQVKIGTQYLFLTTGGMAWERST